MPYRISRNIEASFIDYITDQLITDKWSGINVEKTFAKVYEANPPIVCVRLSDTVHEKVEIGSNATYRIPLVFIDIFATDDGNRLDLKDWAVENLKSRIPYYEYNISNGVVQSKIRNGSIRVLEIKDTLINFDTNKNDLDIRDRYRHLLQLTIDLGRIEE